MARRWRWLAVAAAALFVILVLPPREAVDLVRRVGPILIFLAAITVVAGLADEAGVFNAAAAGAARAGRGSVPRLFLLVAVLSTIVTIVLSLDTTAVLLTPVVLALTRQLSLPVMPFAFGVVWLANTASLLLPVSNLTNLLAAPRLAHHHVSFAVLMAAPALAVLGASLLVLWLSHRKKLQGRYAMPSTSAPTDRVLFTVAAVVCVIAGPLFALGAQPAVVAVSGALVLLVAFAVRSRRAITGELVPWRLVLTTLGLFLLVQAGLHLGLLDLLTGLTGHGRDPIGLLRLTGVAALASNLVNNLPAYLALEGDTGSSATRVAALLIGTNAGPLILPWGSVATLLWWDRCRASGTTVPARDFIRLGLLGVPAVLIAGVAALALSRPGG